MLHVREITSRDPAEAFSAWSGEPFLAWLDSAASGDARSRYSYLCVEPFQVLAATGASVRAGGAPPPRHHA